LYRLLDAGLERFAGTPAEFAFQLAGIDGVALVVAGPVGHERNQLLAARRRRPQPVQDAARTAEEHPDPTAWNWPPS
jgi:hypothetical protein